MQSVRALRTWYACLLGALCTLLCALSPTAAHAAPALLPLDVARLSDGVSMVPYLGVFEDKTGASNLAEVSAPAFAATFTPATQTPDFGFTASAAWVRFEAVNRSAAPIRWLLELDYPHLDDVVLTVQRAQGVLETHTTGDLLPFARRDVPVAQFAFLVESAPGESVTCYLRVDTTGTLRLPLTAWTPDEFYRHELTQKIVLWGFYGSLLMMVMFNLAVWALIRQPVSLTQAFFVFSLWALTFTFGGQTFQYFLPNSPLAANKALNVLFALAASTATYSCAQATLRIPGYEHYTNFLRYAGHFAALLTVFAVFAPKQLGLIVVVTCAISYVIGGMVILLRISGSHHPEVRLFLVSWTCLLVGVPITVMSYTTLLPPYAFFHWAAHLGCAMQALFTSLALAAQVQLMGNDLKTLNGALIARNETLSEALEHARAAKEEAQRATRARDDFLATMSHELRTPLNAIINLPEGLLQDFRESRGARCTSCKVSFILDDGEAFDTQTSCPDCGRPGTLVARTATTFNGDLSVAARFLRKIERAGRHLLHLVNAVLDFSKIEVGALELSLAELDLVSLLREASDELSELASTKGLSIALDIEGESAPRVADALRLKQVLLNLLANAIKFSEQGGVITLSFRRERDADVVSVQDQGIGIAEADHARIFERFEQAQKGDVRKYGGTGLGLAISRALVHLHGGELSVHSRVGEGSTFTFRLPLPLPELARSA